ncbi:MAG: dihydrolipoyl dehydrogenase [Desulfobacterales bacterium]
MSKQITVIGTGPGGYVAAIRAAQLGADVTVIERGDVGGTCLNRGCIPSKVMKATADILEKFGRAREYGIALEETPRADMKAIMARKQSVIGHQAKGIHQLLRKHKIRYLEGQATIEKPNLVIVKSEEGNDLDVPYDGLILAPGSRPLDIPSFPFDGKSILSSDDALSLEKIPESMVIVGGGVIGCEFSFIFSSLGANVTLIEAMSRILPLPTVDEACSRVLEREMKKRRINFIVSRSVNTVEYEGKSLRVTLGPSPFLKTPEEKEKPPLILETDKVLVCVGRRPNTEGIGLEKIGLELDNKGWIIADTGMRTNVSDVYAIGDVLGPEKGMLAHTASAEGHIAAENALGKHETLDYEVVPSTIFTTPEVACVGLTTSQALTKGHEARSDSVLFRNIGKAQVMGDIAGQAKIVSDTQSGKILGVHMIGAHATDLIAEATLALQRGCTVAQLADTIHAHPTLSEVMQEAAFKALDRPLHG